MSLRTIAIANENEKNHIVLWISRYTELYPERIEGGGMYPPHIYGKGAMHVL